MADSVTPDRRRRRARHTDEPAIHADDLVRLQKFLRLAFLSARRTEEAAFLVGDLRGFRRRVGETVDRHSVAFQGGPGDEDRLLEAVTQPRSPRPQSA